MLCYSSNLIINVNIIYTGITKNVIVVREVDVVRELLMSALHPHEKEERQMSVPVMNYVRGSVTERGREKEMVEGQEMKEKLHLIGLLGIKYSEVYSFASCKILYVVSLSLFQIDTREQLQVLFHNLTNAV